MTTEVKTARYIQTVGRRKTSIAVVRMTDSAKQVITVNQKPVDEFFKVASQRKAVRDALVMSNPGIVSIDAKVKGGGMTGQAEAIRLGIARALIIKNIEYRKDLKKAGYLKRDPRAKERRKFGLKKARKAPQWSKR